MQLHSGASLLPMPQIKRGVQTVQIQIGEILLTAYGNEDPFFDADAVPGLVRIWPMHAGSPSCRRRSSRRGWPARA